MINNLIKSDGNFVSIRNYKSSPRKNNTVLVNKNEAESTKTLIPSDPEYWSAVQGITLPSFGSRTNNPYADSSSFENKLRNIIKSFLEDEGEDFSLFTQHKLEEISKYTDEENIADLDYYFRDKTDDSTAFGKIYGYIFYINPVTEKFDISIYNKTKQLAAIYKADFSFIKNLVEASINEETGKTDSVALELTEKILKEYGNYDSVYSGNPADYINALRNKNGGFEKDNLLYLNKILDSEENNNSKDILKIFLLLKNKKGIVTPENFKLYKRVSAHLKDNNSVYNVMKLLSTYNSDIKEEIYDICADMFNEISTPEGFQKNIVQVINQGFDVRGNIQQNQLEIAGDLLQISDKFSYDPSYYEMLKKFPGNTAFTEYAVNSLLKDQYEADLFPSVVMKYTKNKKINPFVQEKMIEFLKNGYDLDYFSVIFDTATNKTEPYSEHFNNQKYIEIISILNILGKDSSSEIKKILNVCSAILNNSLDTEKLNLKENVRLDLILKNLKQELKNNNYPEIKEINDYINKAAISLGNEPEYIQVNKELITDFVETVLKSDASGKELTPFEKIIADCRDQIKKYGKKGLPLTYSREMFLNDLSLICSDDKKKRILRKTRIEPIINDGKITGYNGVLFPLGLDQNDKTEAQIYNCIHKFLFENSINTENSDFNKFLNIIIKAFPEFINIIGKSTVSSGEYSEDIHTLLMTSHVIENNDYLETVNFDQKTILKFACLFSTIMQPENSDKSRTDKSALFAQSYIKKIFDSPKKAARLYDIISCKNWLQEIANAKDKKEFEQKYGFMFRSNGNFNTAKIIAESDLKARGDNVYNTYKNMLANESVKIEEITRKINSTGIAVFTTEIKDLEKAKLFTEKINGKEYKIIDLRHIPGNADMGDFGFEKGIKKEDLRILVHMIPEFDIINKAEAAKNLSNPKNEGILSCSVISPDKNSTYMGRQYGFIFSHENSNILLMNESNIGSGREKDINKFINYVIQGTNCRKTFKDAFLQEAKIVRCELSDNEYAKFYNEVLSDKNSFSEFDDDMFFQVGKHKFSGFELKQILKNTQDRFLNDDKQPHNEIVLYRPELNGLIIKNIKNSEETQQDFLNFAYEHDIPIILI